jgi:uncharacterized protein (UPF0548 family)
VQFLVRLLRQQPSLITWEQKQVGPEVTAGPRPEDGHDSYQRVVAREGPGEPEVDGPFHRLARAIRSYDIFPPALVTPVLRRHPVAIGDTVGILYHGMPLCDLFFAARVSACFDEATATGWRAGFTYQTLPGHAELGEETFSVEKDASNSAVTVALRSWSRPGFWLARGFAPWLRRVQVRVSHAALDHLASVADSVAPPVLGVATRSR